MDIKNFDYNLPAGRIAKFPPSARGNSRLLVLFRKNGKIVHRHYPDLIDYLDKGDVLVLNDTKVFPARLFVKDEKGKRKELLMLEKHEPSPKNIFSALGKGKFRAGEKLRVGKFVIRATSVAQDGIVCLVSKTGLTAVLTKYGHVPLPPYIKRPDNKKDRQRYQTVFAKKIGSAAAPTASLNLTRAALGRIKRKGVRVVYLTLHAGLGTFLPVRANKVERHKMHSEYFTIPKSTIGAIKRARRRGKKIIAVGTTASRALECWAKTGKTAGEADIFIYPPYRFKIVDGLVTNFHAPRSTVLLLASAFAGEILLPKAYREALAKNYKFLSYGDSMLII